MASPHFVIARWRWRRWVCARGGTWCEIRLPYFRLLLFLDGKWFTYFCCLRVLGGKWLPYFDYLDFRNDWPDDFRWLPRSLWSAHSLTPKCLALQRRKNLPSQIQTPPPGRRRARNSNEAGKITAPTHLRNLCRWRAFSQAKKNSLLLARNMFSNLAAAHAQDQIRHSATTYRSTWMRPMAAPQNPIIDLEFSFGSTTSRRRKFGQIFVAAPQSDEHSWRDMFSYDDHISRTINPLRPLKTHRHKPPSPLHSNLATSNSSLPQPQTLNTQVVRQPPTKCNLHSRVFLQPPSGMKEGR